MYTLRSDTKVEAFGLPPGRTPASYFEDLDGAALGVMAIGVISALVIYLVLIRRSKSNFAQIFGYVVIIVIVFWTFGPGLTQMREALIDFWDLCTAWLRG